MKRIPRAKALHKLFVARSRYRPIGLGDGDAKTGSRIAGEPPACFEAAPPACARCRGRLDYFLTLEADVLGSTIAEGRALSLFACRDVDCRLGSLALAAEPPSVVALTHAPSPRVPRDGRRLVRGHLLREELFANGSGSKVEECKLGGAPSPIQPAITEEAAMAAHAGLGFLFQMNEQHLGPFTTSLGFWGGQIYVFSRLDPATRLPSLDGARVSWTFT